MSKNITIGNRLSWATFFIQAMNSIDKCGTENVGFNITQSRILFHVALFPNQPIGNLASTLFLKPSTTTAAVDALVEKGVCERSYNDIDRRNVCISITESGKQLAYSYVDTVKQVFDKAFDPIDVDKSELFFNLLLRESTTDTSFLNDKTTFLQENKRLIADLVNYSIDDIRTFVRNSCILENMCAFVYKSRTLAKSIGLTSNESRILLCVANNADPLSMKEISDTINIRPNVTTVSIASLKKKKLIERTINPEDKRSAAISLSFDGMVLLCENIDDYRSLFDSCFPDLKDYSYTYFANK